MIRGSRSSPLQAKAKRRQSDAKWRASVATCYDALKYVVPNVKNMTKRKVSKALILQESERHIKELEVAISHLLEVESKKRGKTVLWKEGNQWSRCNLDQLRSDFSEKQQIVFHMAAHGRRCYNLLQDIKEEVFAMEADPGRLALLQDTFQTAPSASTSSSSSSSASIVSGNKVREVTAQGAQPTCTINLVLSEHGGILKQQSRTASFEMVDEQPRPDQRLGGDDVQQDDTEEPVSEGAVKELFTSITRRKMPPVSSSSSLSNFVVTTHVSGALAGSSVVTLKTERQAGNFPQHVACVKPTPVAAATATTTTGPRSLSSQSLPPTVLTVSSCVPSVQIKTEPASVVSSQQTEHSHFHNVVDTSPTAQQGSVINNSSSQCNFTSVDNSLSAYRDVEAYRDRASLQFSKASTPSTYDSNRGCFKGKTHSHGNPHSLSLTVSQDHPIHSHEGRKLKVCIENVDGDFYIVSNSNSSISQLIRGLPSMVQNEQEVPSMKLPLKCPTEAEKEKDGSSDHLSVADREELNAPNIKEALAPQTSTSANDGSPDGSTLDMAKEGETDLFAVIVDGAPAQTATPKQADKGSLSVSEAKEETLDLHTPQNDRDPLLSSLVTPKPDEMTPLFLRNENDMVIKRPPRMGTARKKLNFGQCHSSTPNKQDSGTARVHSSAGGFTPVKLPDHFGMMPDADGMSVGCLVSPWKIVESPSFKPRSTPQNYLDSSPVLDLNDSLMCFETMDTMDLDDEEEDGIKYSSLEKDKVQHYEGSCKRKLSPISSEKGIRSQPKCRRNLDSFYGESSSYWEDCYRTSASDSANNLDECHVVPDIRVPVKREPFLQEAYDSTQESGLDAVDGSQQDSKCSDADSAESNEESHVVPDFGETKDQSSPLQSAFYTSNDCDDFDGFYYYYRHMNQQLKKEGQGFTSLKRDVAYEGSGSVHHQCTMSTTPTSNSSSSPCVAAKVAHMWSCLPVQDKITLATLASLEERQAKTTQSTNQDFTNDSKFQQRDISRALEVSESHSTLVLGELSQDLQDVDVQPLVDNVYDHSFDLE